MTLQDLSYKDLHWHSECFLCIKCSRSLVDWPFCSKDDMLMCIECYSNEYSAKCHACLKTIMPGKDRGIVNVRTGLVIWSFDCLKRQYGSASKPWCLFNVHYWCRRTSCIHICLWRFGSLWILDLSCVFFKAKLEFSFINRALAKSANCN